MPRRSKRERRPGRSGTGTKCPPAKNSEPPSNGLKIAFTGFADDERDQLIKAIEKLGGIVDETCDGDGVCVAATDDQNNVIEPNRIKLLNAMCRSDKIVSREWIHASVENGAFLPTEAYFIPTLTATIERGRSARARGGLTVGSYFYLHSSLPHKDRKNLEKFVDITGGKKVNAKEISKLVKDNDGVSRLFVIAKEDADLPGGVSEAIREGANELSCAEFFEAIEKQLSLEEVMVEEEKLVVEDEKKSGDAADGVLPSLASTPISDRDRDAYARAPWPYVDDNGDVRNLPDSPADTASPKTYVSDASDKPTIDKQSDIAVSGATSGITHDVAMSGAISGIAHAHSNVSGSSFDAESSEDDDDAKFTTANLTTLKKLHLETPLEKAAREAKEARTIRMTELAGLFDKKKSEITNHVESLDATLSKMTERQDEDLVLLKERQKIEMAKYIEQQDLELVVATTAHAKEREDFVASHTKRGVALSADRYALMKEFLELENEDQPRPRQGRDRLLGTFFLSHLQRNTTVGLDDILELGEVFLDLYSEGPDHNKKFARMARFEGDRGTVIFLADAPKAGEGMFGNAGNQPIVVWQAFNEKHVQAGGTTIKGAQDPLKSTGSRRYHLHFESNEDVERFLGLLGISLEEWNDPGGRFCPQTSIAPANKHELNDSDMEVEAQNKTITEEDAEKLFGYDPYEVSQKY